MGKKMETTITGVSGVWGLGLGFIVRIMEKNMETTITDLSQQEASIELLAATPSPLTMPRLSLLTPLNSKHPTPKP